MEGFASLSKILDQYTKAAGSAEITLPAGERIKVRVLGSYSELQSLKAEGVNFARSIPLASASEANGHIWEDRLPRTREEAAIAYFLACMVLEPKIEHSEALLMLKAPFLVEFLISELDRVNGAAAAQQFAQGVELAKKKCDETPTSGPGSPSPETSMDDTPTS